jgi:hypothetical protein
MSAGPLAKVGPETLDNLPRIKAGETVVSKQVARTCGTWFAFFGPKCVYAHRREAECDRCAPRKTVPGHPRYPPIFTHARPLPLKPQTLGRRSALPFLH